MAHNLICSDQSPGATNSPLPPLTLWRIPYLLLLILLKKVNIISYGLIYIEEWSYRVRNKEKTENKKKT